MSIASRIESIENHLKDDYQALEDIGADLTNVDKNIENIASVINGIYEELPKVTDEGTEITLDNTRKGKLKLDLKGNTSQNGTPTPDSPVDINVVSGDNAIKIEGKNLLPNNGTSQTINGITFTINEDKSITMNGTATANANLPIFGTGWSATNDIFYLDSTKTYTLGKGTSNAIVYMRNAIDNINFDTPLNLTRAVSNMSCFTYVYIQVPNGRTLNNETIFPMLEVGSTATTYEPYKENIYPINLPVENLFDKNNITRLQGTINNANYFRGGGTNYAVIIPCQPNTTYSVQKRNDGDTNRFALASSKTIPSSVADVDTTLLNNIRSDTASTLTLTTGTTAKYLIVQYYRSAESVLTEQQILDSIQIEKRSKANSYTPYGTTPIELCKIGDYQDEFRKSTGKNLFNDTLELGTIGSTGINNNSTTDVRSVGYIDVDKNTTYTISSSVRGSIALRFYDSTNTFISTGTTATSPNTFTTPTNATKLRFVLLNNTNINSLVQLEKGSSATDPEPYGKGKWYLHKEIGKVVLDGSENWSLKEIYQGITQFQYTKNDVYYANDSITRILSNYFKGVGYSISWTKDNSITVSSNSIRIMISSITTLEDFKIWLSTHNTIVYYVLNTPTSTEITDSTLISQLEAIKYSYQGQTNISQENNDLPFIISASALKDFTTLQ